MTLGYEWGTDRLVGRLDGADGPRPHAATLRSASARTSAREPRTGVQTSRFEILRAMTGRRSRAQVEAYEWDGPPAARAPRARRSSPCAPTTSSNSAWRSPGRSPRSAQRLDYARFWFGAFVSNIGTWMETVAVGHPGHHPDRAGGLGRHRGRGRVRALARSPGSSAAPSPTGSRRRRCSITTMSIQTALAAPAHGARGASTPHSRSASRSSCSRSGDRGGDRLPHLPGAAPRPRAPPRTSPRPSPSARPSGTSAAWSAPRSPASSIGLGGFAWAFAFNTLSFFAVIVAVAPMRLPPPPPHNGESIRTSISGGFRFVRRDSGVRAELTYLALNSLLAAPFIALIPAVALKVFDNEDLGTAILVTAQGLGAVLMAVLMGGLSFRFGLRRVVLGAVLVLPFTLMAYAQAPTFGLAAVAIFFVGSAYLGCLSGVNTVAQMRAPNDAARTGDEHEHARARHALPHRRDRPGLDRRLGRAADHHVRRRGHARGDRARHPGPPAPLRPRDGPGVGHRGAGRRGRPRPPPPDRTRRRHRHEPRTGAARQGRHPAPQPARSPQRDRPRDVAPRSRTRSTSSRPTRGCGAS